MHRNDPRQTTHQSERPNDRVAIQLLGGFEVSVNGRVTPARGWTRRNAAALIKVLALAPRHRLHREQVIDTLWPDESPAGAAPKLHKAAHYARKVAGRGAVVLRNDVVRLFPAADLAVDVTIFEELSRRAIAADDPVAAREAVAHYTGELLPDDRYAEWLADRRELLRLRHLHLLHLAGDWMEASEADPSNETAHLELMRMHSANGDHRAALLQYERMERSLARELGVSPGYAARALREHIASIPTAVPNSEFEPGAIESLLADLAELTRRQVTLLETLAALTRDSASPGPGW